MLFSIVHNDDECATAAHSIYLLYVAKIDAFVGHKLATSDFKIPFGVNDVIGCHHSCHKVSHKHEKNSERNSHYILRNR